MCGKVKGGGCGLYIQMYRMYGEGQVQVVGPRPGTVFGVAAVEPRGTSAAKGQVSRRNWHYCVERDEYENFIRKAESSAHNQANLVGHREAIQRQDSKLRHGVGRWGVEGNPR